MNPHKGTELNNVKETWQQNEQQNANAGEPTGVSSALQQTIKDEAAEYDGASKEGRILDGDRASVNDDNGGDR